MGNRWEVSAYRHNDRNGYEFFEVYVGQSMIRALYATMLAKRTYEYVKVEWS